MGGMVAEARGIEIPAGASFGEDCNQAELEIGGQAERPEEKDFGSLNGRRNRIGSREGEHRNPFWGQCYSKIGGLEPNSERVREIGLCDPGLKALLVEASNSPA